MSSSLWPTLLYSKWTNGSCALELWPELDLRFETSRDALEPPCKQCSFDWCITRWNRTVSLRELVNFAHLETDRTPLVQSNSLQRPVPLIDHQKEGRKTFPLLRLPCTVWPKTSKISSSKRAFRAFCSAVQKMGHQNLVTSIYYWHFFLYFALKSPKWVSVLMLDLY